MKQLSRRDIKAPVTGGTDLLNGPIAKSVLIFMIPILISNVFQQLYNTLDTVIVGHVLGETSLAAIGAASSPYEFMLGFSFGISVGMTIVAARAFGRGDMEMLKKAVASSLVIGLVLTLIITVATRFILRPLLVLINTPDEIIEESLSYITIITLFFGVTIAYNLLSGLLRAIGNSVMPLVFLIISSVINIILDYTFMGILHLGIWSAAAATVMAQCVSVILCVIYIAGNEKNLIPGRRHFSPDGALYREMLAQGLAVGLMNSIVGAGSVILQSGINGLGYLVIAGHTAGRKLFSFFMMLFSAMGNAMGTFASQNYGARQIGRIRKGVKFAYLYGLVMAGALTAIMIFAAPLLLKAVSGSDQEIVLRNGTLYLQVAVPFFAVLQVVQSTRMALQSIGQKILPICSSVIELIGKILFVRMLIPVFGYRAVVFCEPVIWCLMAVELALSFWLNPIIRKK